MLQGSDGGDTQKPFIAFVLGINYKPSPLPFSIRWSIYSNDHFTFTFAPIIQSEKPTHKFTEQISVNPR
jgi:hypothetical protein